MTPQDGVRRGTTHVELNESREPSDMLRLARLGRELRLTDQILTSDMDTVSIVEDGPAPAWTTLDGDHVTFAAQKMPKPNSRVNVGVWLGTNAHELGHVLFTPRRESPLIQRVFDSDKIIMPGLAKLHNIVEDQRQERFILARFAPWRGYLIAALSHHLVVDSESAWLLMAGRTWIPDSMRAAARDKFVAARSESVAAKVASLIGNYQRLTDPGEGEADNAFAILDELWSIFCDKLPSIPTGCTTVIADGEPDTSSPDPANLPAAADEQSDSDDADDDAGEGEPADGEQSEGDSDGPDADAQPADAEGSSSGNTTSEQVPPPDVSNADQVRKSLQDAAQDVLQKDERARRDLDHVLDALRQSRGEGVDGDDRLGDFVEPSDAARRLHSEVGDALLDLKDQTEPGWQRRVDSGRLNVRRLFSPVDVPYDELFDRYQPGEMDAADFDVVLLLDTSSSMNRYRAELAEATWAIHHAADDLDARVTIISWNDDNHRVVAKPGERPDGRVFSPQTGGGTHPTSALTEAFHALSDSQARNRIMLILTDGAWSGAERSEKLIAAMNAAGITTAFAFLGHDHLYDGNTHGCSVGERIDEPAGLARLFRRVAAERIRANF